VKDFDSNYRYRTRVEDLQAKYAEIIRLAGLGEPEAEGKEPEGQGEKKPEGSK
jgi:hypothetical protein